MIACCRDAAPFKATAGLHHAVRRGEEHGFLNLLAATTARPGRLEAVLAEQDPAALDLASPTARSSGASAAAAGASRSTTSWSWGCSRDARVRRRGAAACARGRRHGGRPPPARLALRGAVAERVHGRGAGGLAPGGAPGRRARGAGAELGLPFEVADYVDFYSSLHHATNLGRMFRPDAEPLLPNWRHAGGLPRPQDGRAERDPVRRPRPAPREVRTERAARHRARGRLRDRRRARQANRYPRAGLDHVFGMSRERLVRARHTGVGVPAARAVPRQVVRHLGEPLGGSARGAGGPPLPGDRRTSRCRTSPRSPGRTTYRWRSS